MTLKYNLLNYKLMRMRKYYDVLRTNEPFMKTSLIQKYKIINNIIKFFNTINTKPLIINNKPVTAQIEPTSNCNLRCTFCAREHMGVPIGTMTFENFKKVLDALDCLYKINISGQGELFMNPELFDMIKYANSRGILIHISSNGTLLSDRVIDSLCEVDVGEIGISVDSVDKERYEKIRINSNFDLLVRNIKKLTTRFKEREVKTIVTMASIIFKESVHEVPEFIELANEVGIKKVAFQTLQTKENFVSYYGDEMKSNLVDKEIIAIRNYMKKAIELAKKYGITLIFDEEESPGCIWPWRGIYVTWNGDVTSCCKILETSKFGMGNIIKQDFWEVWNGEKYQMTRRLLRDRMAPESCKGCNRV